MEPSADRWCLRYGPSAPPNQIGQRRGLGPDRISFREPVEPPGRDGRRAVERAEQRPGNRGVRVGVTAEADHVPQAVLEAESLAGDLKRDARGEQTEPLVGAVDLAGPAGFTHQELELLSALSVGHDPQAVQNGRIPRLA